MDAIEKKRHKIRELINLEGAPNLAKRIERKCGAIVAPSTINRAANNSESSVNTLCYIHYVLTH